jgi:hypothetical protein
LASWWLAYFAEVISAAERTLAIWIHGDFPDDMTLFAESPSAAGV